MIKAIALVEIPKMRSLWRRGGILVELIWIMDKQKNFWSNKSTGFNR